MQSRVATSFIQTQLLLFKSRNSCILPSGVPHRLFSTDHPCERDLKGDDDVIGKEVAQPPPSEKPHPAVVEKAADPLGPPKQPLSNPKLENSTGPPEGHHKFQKRHIHESSAVLGKGKPKSMDEQVVVWMPEQIEHPEETMIKRPKEIWERNRMRGDPHSPQSKLLRALRGEEEDL